MVQYKRKFILTSQASISHWVKSPYMDKALNQLEKQKQQKTKQNKTKQKTCYPVRIRFFNVSH